MGMKRGIAYIHECDKCTAREFTLVKGEIPPRWVRIVGTIHDDAGGRPFDILLCGEHAHVSDLLWQE